MAAAIAHFISFEVRDFIDASTRLGSLAALRSGAAVAVVGVITVIYVALKIITGAVEPRTSADENAAGKPFRTVIAVRSAAIGNGVVITVGTFGSGADFEPDFLRPTL